MLIKIPRLSEENIAFVFIDLQERLLSAIPDSEKLIRKNRFLLESAKVFGIPFLASTQYKKGLGEIVSGFAEGLNSPARDKTSFSCGMDPSIAKMLRDFQREWVVISGVETHICVMQTVLDLTQTGYQVAVVVDAVGSRNGLDHQWGLERMKQAGNLMVTSEMLVYELLRSSDSDNFKRLLPLIKQLES
jgi:nicotinamidase-related amidase